MRFRTKLKLIMAACGCVLTIACFVAFNNFGIDADTIYKLQGEMSASVYNQERGYKYSGNEIPGVFQNVEEEVMEGDTEAIPSEGVFEGDTVKTVPDTTPVTTVAGVPTPLFKQSDPQWGSLNYYPGNSISKAGCFPTSLAMIVDHMTGSTDTPDVVVKWIQDNVSGYYVPKVGSSHNVIGPVVEHYGLHVELCGVSMTKERIQECLDNGGCVFFRTGKGWFTSYKHGMCILSYAGDRDHVYINNPSNSGNSSGCPAGNGSNYNDAYAFSIDDICNSPATSDTQMWTIYK